VSTTLRVTVQFSYEVPDDRRMAAYGTTDPEKMAAIDQENYEIDPNSLIDVISLAAEEETLTIQVVMG
jgi:hypothetical protein